MSTAGYYTLEWAPPPGDSEEAPSFELVEATDANFDNSHVIYRGPDLATTISGKEDGTYFYRIRTVVEGTDETGPWSNVHRVVVDHHELGRAFTFLVVGAIVFAATLAVILIGNLRERDSSQSETT